MKAFQRLCGFVFLTIAIVSISVLYTESDAQAQLFGRRRPNVVVNNFGNAGQAQQIQIQEGRRRPIRDFLFGRRQNVTINNFGGQSALVAQPVFLNTPQALGVVHHQRAFLNQLNTFSFQSQAFAPQALVYVRPAPLVVAPLQVQQYQAPAQLQTVPQAQTSPDCPQQQAGAQYLQQPVQVVQQPVQIVQPQIVASTQQLYIQAPRQLLVTGGIACH